MESRQSDEDVLVSSIDIRLFSDHYWGEIMKKLKRGILFLDNDIYRVLHFNGGVGRLFREGKILGLKEFSSFNYGSRDEKKGIFILSSPLSGLTVDKLKEVICGSSFEYVQVIGTSSIHDLNESEDQTNTSLKELEEQILEWMGDFNFTCEIFHYPLLLAPLAKELFLTPAFDSLSPLHFDYSAQVEGGEKKEEAGGSEGVFLWSRLPTESKITIRRFASFWASFLGMYGVKPDIFTVGGLSSLIGDRLNLLLSNKAPPNPNAVENKVSLLFLDRTLDLFSVLNKSNCNDGGETALEGILEHLDPYPGSKEDVSVDMSELFNSSDDFSTCPPGCLAGNQAELFEALLKPPKESMRLFQSRLANASKGVPENESEAEEESNLANEFIDAIRGMKKNESGDVLEHRIIRDIRGQTIEKPEEILNPLLHEFKLQEDKIHEHCELLQKSFALRNAALRSMTSKEEKNRFREIQGRLLKDLFSKYPENVFESLIQLVKNEADLSLSEIFELLIFTYARIPTESAEKDPEARDELESLISDRLLTVEPLPSFLEEGIDELSAHKIVKAFFRKCVRLNKNTSPLLRRTNHHHHYVELLLNDIYVDGPEAVPHLVYKSRGSLGGRLIKSGLSFLGLSVKEKSVHPRENPIVILFLVGGITPGEIRRIRTLLESKKAQAQYILASNSLLHSKSLLDQFFLADATE